MWEVCLSLEILLPFLVGIAFFTLLERKFLGLAQSRKGPNKVSVGGLLQPGGDAVKLFSKERILPLYSKRIIFYIRPFIFLLLSLCLWVNIEVDGRPTRNAFSRIFLLVVLRLGLYPLIFRGWASGRAFSLIGRLRGLAQTISYEIRLSLLLLRVLLYRSSYSWEGLIWIKRLRLGVISLLPLLIIWLIRRVAESNRTPFDFSEGESELVSGFNTEYGGGGFAVIFMAEYGNIIRLRAYASLLFVGSRLNIVLRLVVFLFRIIWIWLRATLPRYRYDLLIRLAWKILLPCSLASVVLLAWETVL